MTQKPFPNPAQALEQIYTEQAELYHGLLRLAEDLSTAISLRKDTQPVLIEMGRFMDQIADLNQQAVPVRDRWTSAGCQSATGLAQAVKKIEKLIVTSIQQIDSAETSARKAKDAMVPVLSHENTRRKMRAAYASATHNARPELESE